MHKLSATERLRELLDEREVFWIDIPLVNMKRTCWKSSDEQDGYCYFDEDAFGVIELTVTSITPAQAIAATLGAGTCKAIISDNLTESEGTGDAWADCSECGHLLYVLTDPNSEPPNYCPNCGAKVIG